MVEPLYVDTEETFKHLSIMATMKVINGEQVRVNTTAQGEIYSKNFRSLKEEVNSVGTADFRINKETHAFFLGGNAYYVGKSLHGMGANEIAAKAKDIQICDSSTDGSKWVPCLFLSNTGEAGTLMF